MKLKLLTPSVLLVSILMLGLSSLPQSVSAIMCDMSINAGVSVSPTQVAKGDSVTVNWGVSYSNAVDYGGVSPSVSLSGPGAPSISGKWHWEPNSAVADDDGGSFVVQDIQQDTNWTIDASISSPNICPEGTSDSEIAGVSIISGEIIIKDPPCVINSFDSEKSTVASGAGTLLRFSLTNSASWKIDLLGGGELSSGTEGSGSRPTGNLTQTQVYRMTCTPLGDGAKDSEDWTVSVLPPPGGGGSAPTVSLSASRNSMTWPTNSMTLSWTTGRNPDSCVASGDWSGDKSSGGGSQSMTGMTVGSHTFTITCSNDEGSGSDSTVVNVNPQGSSCSDNADVSVLSGLPSGDLSPGTDYNFSVGSKNTGNTWWYHGGVYRLLQKSPFNINPSYGHLSGRPEPGDAIDWNFTLNTPTAPGNYTFSTQMIHYAWGDYKFVGGAVCAPPPSDDSWLGNTMNMNFSVANPPGHNQAYGYLDSNAGSTNNKGNCSTLDGWAWDPDYPDTTIAVHIYKDGVFYKDIYPSDFREDLPGSKNHAFTYTIPSDWKNNENHVIRFYAIDQNDDGNPELIDSPVNINCSTSLVPEDGQCGEYNKTYPYSATSYGSGDYCKIGDPSSRPAFPPADGSYVTWTCSGVDGGQKSFQCTATHTGPPITGVGECGSANQIYPYSATSYGGDSFCSLGTPSPSSPAFPNPGQSINWQCVGSGGPSNNCSASHSNTPPVNTAPNPPTITGPTAGNINTDYTFAIESVDPDLDQVRYGVDLDTDGTVDQWMPSGGSYVNSGTSRTMTRKWNSVGTKTFQAVSQDTLGHNSSWTTHSITLVDGEKVNGVCGTANRTYPVGSTSYGTDTYCTAGNASGQPPFPPAGSSSTWQCLGINGGVNSPWCVAVNPPTINPPGICNDPKAVNWGGALPCRYDSGRTCDDPRAVNWGGALPCRYDSGATCTDSGAVNWGGPLPCTYGPGAGRCADPSANNYGNPLPCTYGPGGGGSCSDPSADNFRDPLPCTYSSGPGPFTLTVTTSAGGKVKSTDNLISCNPTCSYSYARDSSVTLKALPNSSYWKFTGWSGACSDTSNTCSLLMGNTTSVSANFRLRLFDYFEF